MRCKDCKYYQHVKNGRYGSDRGICMQKGKGYGFIYGNSHTCAKCEVRAVNVMDVVESVRESDCKGSKIQEYIAGSKTAIEIDNNSRECSWKMHRCPNCGLAFHYGIPEWCPNCKKMMRR